MFQKIMLLFFFGVSVHAVIAQTDNYTDKLQQLYSDKEYYKVMEYKSKKEPEMASYSLYIKGLAWFMTDYERKAIYYFDMAIDKGPVDANMYFFKGVCHLILEEYAESEAALKAAIELEDDDAAYIDFLGRAYFEQEKYEEALACFKKAAAMEIEDGELFSRAGDCHMELKQYTEAAVAYSKAYEFASNYKYRKYADYQWAEALYLAGDYAGAKTKLLAHVKEFKNSYEAYSLQIQVANATGETGEVKDFESKINVGKKGDMAFPGSLSKMFCIDRFEVQSNPLEVFQAYDDQSYQVYPWKHKFEVLDSAGETIYTIETQLDSTAGNENTYTICRAQGDSLLKYGNVVYDDSFNYAQLKEQVKKIISGETLPAEIVTGYTAWLETLKKSRTGGDGMSFETAIMAESIAAEYAYLRENYPGYTFKMQALVTHDGVPYDILYIETEDGEKLEIYFNISSFFGKW